ncbi:hypothetical protein CPB84DRAFT_1752082 [Gymnopilus junonius]|uniref:Uncharacterized protein n=1 Tax=Gymnopilus junonius TaxID=109634 RepID=A0A9P5NCB0_GYMJU|nr:hypothetical protein CPB84DRAFT_1752082 [Gymnopilus junonius]
MLWMQFTLSVMWISFGPTSKPISNSQRPLMLNIAFYGITAITSSGLTVTGIIIHWLFTFTNQYLFLQALFVWASYHLMTIIHDIMPNNDHDQDGVEATTGFNIMSSRAMDVIGESTNGKQRKDIFPWWPMLMPVQQSWLRDVEARWQRYPNGQNSEKFRAHLSLCRPGWHSAPVTSLSSDYASAMFVMNSSEAILGHNMKEQSMAFLAWLWRALPMEGPKRNASIKSHQENNFLTHLLVPWVALACSQPFWATYIFTINMTSQGAAEDH